MKNISILLIAFSINTSMLFGSATEVTQIANNIQLVAQYLKQVEQLAQEVKTTALQVQRYQHMVKEAGTLPLNLLSDFKNDLAKLDISKQKINDFLEDLSFQNEMSTISNNNIFGKSGNTPTNIKSTYSSLYDSLIEKIDDQNQKLLNGVNKDGTEAKAMRDLLDQLNANNATAQTQKEILQVANQMSASQVQNLNSISTIMSSNIKDVVEQRQAKAAQKKLDLLKNSTFFQPTSDSSSKPHKSKKITDY